MLEVAQAVFFFWSISLCKHSESKQTHIRRPAGWRHECTLTHGPAYANTPTPDHAALPLSSRQGCTHVAAVTRVKSQASCSSSRSGRTLSHMSTFRQPSKCVFGALCLAGVGPMGRARPSLLLFILTPAYQLFCSTDVGGADVPPVRFM